MGRRLSLTGTLVIADGRATSFGIGADTTTARAAETLSDERGADNEQERDG